MQLNNKIGLITGGSTGIGFATAKRALIEGAKAVAITGQNEKRLKMAYNQLSEFGEVITVHWSAESTEMTQQLISTLKNHYDSIDFAFLNAGVCWPTPLGEVAADDIQQQFMINFTAPMLLTQALVPLMKDGGAIALTTSCLHQLGMPGYAAYSASKAALRSLARTLSAELMEKNIRVNTLAPGPFETPIHTKFGMDEASLTEMKKQVSAMVPLGRMGELEEIAGAAVLLLSDNSRYMLGEEISVDGGWSNL